MRASLYLLLLAAAMPPASAQAVVHYDAKLELPIPADLGIVAPGGTLDVPLIAYYNLSGGSCGAPSGTTPSISVHFSVAITSDTPHVAAAAEPPTQDVLSSRCDYQFPIRLRIQGNPDSPVASTARLELNANASGACTFTGAAACDAATADVKATPRVALVLGGNATFDSRAAALDSGPWYRAPLAPDNLPNTLQVAGALFAVATFLVGFAIVRRRRNLTRTLLHQIDELEREHADDQGALRHALVNFDAYCQSLVTRGKLAEEQYAIVARRMDREPSPTARRRG